MGDGPYAAGAVGVPIKAMSAYPEATIGPRASGPTDTSRPVAMWREPRTALRRYGVALAATLAALLLRLALGPAVRDTSPFLFFVPAVMLSAWYGGFGPGLLATVVGAVAGDYLLLEPLGAFLHHDPVNTVRLVVFVLVGFQISWLGGALYASKQRAEADAAAARRNEQLYRTLAANFPDGVVCLFDRDLRWTLAEGSALSDFGLTGGRPGEGRIVECLPRETAGQVEAICRKALETGTPVSDEVSHTGRIYFVQAVPLPRVASTDSANAGMAIMQDVTDRARARDALRRAHDELEQRVRERTSELNFQKTLLESQSEASRDAIVAVSEEGKIIFSNQRFEELWANAARNGSGRVDDVRREMASRLAEPAAYDPLGTDAEWRGRSSEGAFEEMLLRDGRTLERYSAPIVNSGGTNYGRVWFFRDITERKRMEKEILEAGERERQRIGQDLHDDLCQQLSGIACLGRVLERQLANESPDAAGQAGEIAQLMQQAAARARDLARGLHPVNLTTDGLEAALKEFCASAESMFQVSCAYRGQGDVAVGDTATAAHLYRIVQEAVHNAVRHGRAANVAVDLVSAGERIVLTVEDDGVGIPDELPQQGMGLHTMSFRARMIGASLSVERGDGGGTVVTCALRRPAPPSNGNSEADYVEPRGAAI